MVSLLSRGFGVVIKSLAGLSCTRTARCVSFNALSTIQCTSARWFSKKENHSLPDVPKRPLSAFFRFLFEQKPHILAKHPDLTNQNLCKMAGEKWRALTDGERQVYIDAARPELMQFKDHIKKYKENLNPLDIKLLNKERSEKRQNRKRNRLRKELKASGIPKHPRNSYQFFLSENLHEVTKETFSEKCVELLNKWRNMTSTEKEVYKQLSEDDKIRYINERKAWEEHMVKIGREEFIQLSKQSGKPDLRRKEAATQRHSQSRKSHNEFL